jgi:hypothetical protein
MGLDLGACFDGLAAAPTHHTRTCAVPEDAACGVDADGLPTSAGKSGWALLRRFALFWQTKVSLRKALGGAPLNRGRSR